MRRRAWGESRGRGVRRKRGQGRVSSGGCGGPGVMGRRWHRPSRGRGGHFFSRAAAAGQGGRRQCTHRLRRLLNLDEAHAAVSGDREALVEAEAGHINTRRLDGLQDARTALDLHSVAIDDDLNILPTLLWDKSLTETLVNGQRLRKDSQSVLADGLHHPLRRHGQAAQRPRCSPLRHAESHSGQPHC